MTVEVEEFPSESYATIKLTTSKGNVFELQFRDDKERIEVKLVSDDDDYLVCRAVGYNDELYLQAVDKWSLGEG